MAMGFSLFCVPPICLFGLVFFMDSKTKTPPHDYFRCRSSLRQVLDYIIVGGGTAGCPLAATLSEKFSVLLVERGGSTYGNPLILENRNYGLLLLQTDEYTSVAQHFVSKDGVSNFRGRVLGGGSAVYSGVFSSASEDYVEKVGWNKMALDA